MTQARSVRWLGAVCSLAFAVTTSAVADDPVQWPVPEGGTGHYYEYRAYIGRGTTLWEDAKLAAEASEWLGNQGYLTSILSEPEGQWILDTLFPVVGPRVPWAAWIGAFRDDTDSPWQWVSGEAWNDAYEPWTPGVIPAEPGDAVYAAFTYRGLPDWWGSWNGVEPDEEYLVTGYIIEYALEPATVSLLVAGGLILMRRRRS